VKAAFAHRRKTLVNSLRDEGYLVPTVTQALQSMSIMAAVRAEALTLGQFIELARQVDRATAP
jgi:16S rRNA (adenine1518-N6/adenine1519-N6)-dimethyltransferase